MGRQDRPSNTQSSRDASAKPASNPSGSYNKMKLTNGQLKDVKQPKRKGLSIPSSLLITFPCISKNGETSQGRRKSRQPKSPQRITADPLPHASDALYQINIVSSNNREPSAAGSDIPIRAGSAFENTFQYEQHAEFAIDSEDLSLHTNVTGSLDSYGPCSSHSTQGHAPRPHHMSSIPGGQLTDPEFSEFLTDESRLGITLPHQPSEYNSNHGAHSYTSNNIAISTLSQRIPANQGAFGDWQGPLAIPATISDPRGHLSINPALSANGPWNQGTPVSSLTMGTNMSPFLGQTPECTHDYDEVVSFRRCRICSNLHLIVPMRGASQPIQATQDAHNQPRSLDEFGSHLFGITSAPLRVPAAPDMGIPISTESKAEVYSFSRLQTSTPMSQQSLVNDSGLLTNHCTWQSQCPRHLVLPLQTHGLSQFREPDSAFPPSTTSTNFSDQYLTPASDASSYALSPHIHVTGTSPDQHF